MVKKLKIYCRDCMRTVWFTWSEEDQAYFCNICGERAE